MPTWNRFARPSESSSLACWADACVEDPSLLARQFLNSRTFTIDAATRQRFTAEPSSHVSCRSCASTRLLFYWPWRLGGSVGLPVPNPVYRRVREVQRFPSCRSRGGVCGPNKARRRPRRKVQRINVSTRPVRNAETIGIWLLSQSPWTLRARGAARDRRPGSRTATGRGKAAHYAIILLSPVWVSNTRLRGRPSSFDVVSKRLKRFTAHGRPAVPPRASPAYRSIARIRSVLLVILSFTNYPYRRSR